MAAPLTSESLLTVLILAILCVVSSEEAHIFAEDTSHNYKLPPIVEGLSWTFYDKSCPELESIVQQALKPFLDEDITQAAGLLRLHFHDCFVQGCDGSLLLNGSATEESEQSAPPNLTLRPEAFSIVGAIKAAVEAVCPTTVSCADIVTLAARDSVAMTKGPRYPVPLGRRDSTSFANKSIVQANLPSPTFNVTSLMGIFSSKDFNIIDLVALSGGHTIGRAHCGAFVNRLYPQDPALNPELASQLQIICPTSNSSNTTNMDIYTPNRFDMQYYRGLVNGDGLFTSDSSLVIDAQTNATILSYLSNETLFFEQFSLSMIKMGQLGVLKDMQGEIRTNCSITNPTSYLIKNGQDEDIIFSF